MKVKILIFFIFGFFVSGKALVLLPDSTLYLSNMTSSVGGAIPVGSNQWLAQSFETGTASTGYILDLFLTEGTGVPPGIDTSIYSNNNGIPGNSLAGVGMTLSPSTTYWIVATAASTGFDFWNYASDTGYYSMDNWNIDLLNATYAMSSDGASWTSYAAHPPFQIEVEATPAPEPKTFALVGLGLATVFFRCRK
jgi:hypothetical protein